MRSRYLFAGLSALTAYMLYRQATGKPIDKRVMLVAAGLAGVAAVKRLAG